MASDAATLIAAAQGLEYDALSDRSTLLSLVGYFAGQTGLTAQDAIEQAAALGYQSLSERDLMSAILMAFQ